MSKWIFKKTLILLEVKREKMSCLYFQDNQFLQKKKRQKINKGLINRTAVPHRAFYLLFSLIKSSIRFVVTSSLSIIWQKSFHLINKLTISINKSKIFGFILPLLYFTFSQRNAFIWKKGDSVQYILKWKPFV